MSQGLRELLANRRFAIPLIILMAFCLIGLILIGVVLILRPGAPSGEGPVAQATLTATSQPTTTPFPPPTSPTSTPTLRATATFVPVGTPVESETQTAAVTAEPGQTGTATVEAGATVAPTSEETATPEDEELAETGVGWGLILGSSIGLALLVLAARRLRLAS